MITYYVQDLHHCYDGYAAHAKIKECGKFGVIRDSDTAIILSEEPAYEGQEPFELYNGERIYGMKSYYLEQRYSCTNELDAISFVQRSGHFGVVRKREDHHNVWVAYILHDKPLYKSQIPFPISEGETIYGPETVNVARQTWVSILPLLLLAYTEGTDKGRQLALEELNRMARKADEN